MVDQIKTRYSLAWFSKLSEIPRSVWDAMALPLKTPFLEWEWLNNLETSGSAIARAGWQPNHLTVWRDRTLIAAAPLYLKSHSSGEFVFDHQLADLSHRIGIEYYPKLLGMSPFTPAVGYRFLMAPDVDEEEVTTLMVREIDQFCTRHHLSGCNFLFVDPDWRSLMERLGFTSWMHHGYIWQNQGFQTFDDYLKCFNSNQRRNIKRERKAVTTAGLRMQVHQGEEISVALLSLVYAFYADTCDKFGWWGSKYLTRQFFEQLQANYCDRVVLFAAYTDQDPQTPVGMSFCLTKGENLYGRYWGSFRDFDCLHFDACYYSPIAWAIEQGIQMFDPGAGGRHKQRRGFPATPHSSLHRFYPARLAQIWQANVDSINEQAALEIELLNQELPFKQENSSSLNTNTPQA
jgi:uncharacterized protein